VPVDIVARSGERVAPWPVHPAGDTSRNRIAGILTGEGLEQRHHELDQIALDLDLAGAVGIAESNLGVAQQSEQRTSIRDPHMFDRLSRIRSHALARPKELEFDGRIPQ